MYNRRIIEGELERKLNASGAVLIRGPKSCGKTETAKQFAKSVLEVDRDSQVPVIMATNPNLLLAGDTPRLIDEWQEQPTIWNYIRHEVDDRKAKGQFILTGSSNPNDNVRLHSGAGRFTIIEMNTMTWREMGFSDGSFSMADLLQGNKIDAFHEAVSLEFIIDRLIIGGFPALLGTSIAEASDINNAYIDLLAEVDMSRVSEIKRDPIKVRALLRSLARNTAT
ncbi:MAG: AAA family ATPase, partial [Candidatus Symbiothrix sp.]|nr:AAA family ATPase [Candidatus Symbiothrix sp.]